MTEYSKQIKKRLIDIDKSQKWLVDEVQKETGLFFDGAYLSKIVNGNRNAPKIVAAINKVLEI